MGKYLEMLEDMIEEKNTKPSGYARLESLGSDQNQPSKLPKRPSIAISPKKPEVAEVILQRAIEGLPISLDDAVDSPIFDVSILEQIADGDYPVAFLRQYIDQGSSPICGNGICQDRRFLVRNMPELADFFHYRNLDVSTLKILAQLWAPDLAARFDKHSTHLALADVHDSIRELRFYRERLLKF